MTTAAFSIISLRWRITLLKQRGLIELREIAETLSLVYVKVFRLFIWLYENTRAVGELPRSRNSKKRKKSHRQGKKVSSEWRLLSKTNFVTCRSTYHSSCYWIEYSEPACIEKAYVVETYSVYINKTIIWVSVDKHSNKFVLLVILTWSGVRSVAKYCKNSLNADIFLQVLAKRGKNLP